MKALYLILANLSLPFLLFYMRNTVYKIYYVFYLKDSKKEVPQLNTKLAFKLFVCGLVLLTATLLYLRAGVSQEPRGDYNKVKQYNFR
jgi:hypothetical protein